MTTHTLESRLRARMRCLEIRAAMADLKAARERLLHVGAKQATDATRRALKSTEGALRHAERYTT